MFNYREQLSIIEKIRMSEGDHKTIDCPFCGGRNKFTIDKFDGVLVWNCFRASCTAKGSHRGKRDATAIRNYLNDTPTQRHRRRLNRLPDLTTQARKHGPAMEYLQSVNSLEAYEQGLIKVRYSPKDNRVLFFTNDGTGAVGRALDKRLPKWWNYGDTSCGIIVGSGDHIVLVEDVASACSVSRLEGAAGFALLGTNLTKGIRYRLNTYKKVTLVLDSDASAKALLLASKFSQLNHVRLTHKDVKWLDVEEIEKILT